MYDQDEQYDAFCGCVTCDVEDEEELDIGSVLISEISGGEFVCGADTEFDDDLVTSDYGGLRDVDGWQRRDPWGGSAGDVPKRAQVSSTPTFLSTPISPSRI